MFHSEIVTAVYGDEYNNALVQQKLLHKAIQDRRGIGFDDVVACEHWAHEHLLDIVMLSKTTHKYYYLTHHGDILEKNAWINCYSNILFTWRKTKNGMEPNPWLPSGFDYLDKARVNGEKEDYGRQPLYHRDYFTPMGYYNVSSGTFNIAKISDAFAKETGRDTSHIYTLIKAISGECYLHLLAWLRMKMCYPKQKTQVVPIIVSRTQGTGKSTFAEVICKGLFGKDNVLVTDQYDSNSRFNADYADALIVCHEEKEYEDKRNSAAALKSRATATTIRKEHKGLDPIYQESYTDFIMTSNKDVPIKFEDDTDQRRFMVMEADENFTRKTSTLADEVFTKLYGYDANGVPVGVPFIEDVPLIQQFKHELFSNEEIAKTEVRKFPHTTAYNKCRTLPRTTEATEIESIVRSLVPFIKASLEEGITVTEVTLATGEKAKLSSYIQTPSALQYYPAFGKDPAFVALCRPLIFYDIQSGKAFQHATVERSIYDCNKWLQTQGLKVWANTEPVPGGFYGVHGRYRNAPTARFVAIQFTPEVPVVPSIEITTPVQPVRIGQRLRVNGKWQPDPNGEFETLNEMKPGITTLENKTKHVQYMDTFLFEADETTRINYMMEQEQLARGVMDAEHVFYERLRIQRTEAGRLFKSGKIARVVYSGGKSYHMLVRIKNAPTTIEEYKFIHAQLCTELSTVLNFDPSVADPARLTRAPITFIRTFDYNGYTLTGKQRLIDENWNNILECNWHALYQQWLERPLKDYERNGKKLLPTKQEYIDAMFALLKGRFFTDSAFNGQRQRVFFPAYRLCRYLGYSHDDLWRVDGILEDVDRYYKRNEVGYWRSRESCDLIKQIDKDIEAMQSV